MNFITLFISLCCAYIVHSFDRSASINHLEKYITVTHSQEQFSNELQELKTKVINVEELRSAGKTVEADELDKTIEEEIVILRQNIARHSSANKVEAKSKAHIEDARTRLEKVFAKGGKENLENSQKTETTIEVPTTNTELNDSPPKQSPEEAKQLKEDMINKQKEFLDHRKQELTSRISKAGFSEEEEKKLLLLVDEYVASENEVMESRNKLFAVDTAPMDSTQRVQYHRDMKLRRDKEKKASDNARLKRKEIDDALRKKIFGNKEKTSTQNKKEEL